MSSFSFAHPLISNGLPLANASQSLGWLEPSDPTWPLSRLRAQYQTQGYLWLQGLLPRQQVLTVRRQFFEAFSETGLLAPDSDPEEGIFSGNRVSPEVFQRILIEATHLPAYLDVCMSPLIWHFYEEFLGVPSIFINANWCA